MEPPFTCRICGCQKMEIVKRSNIEGTLSSRDYAITDYRYGMTDEIWRCGSCGFMQCPRRKEVLNYYEELEDHPYEESRAERSLQSGRILNTIRKYKEGGRLLDVGAGSGILVEQAIRRGYDAEGVEPSKWLQERARKLGLPVLLGAFPDPRLKGPYQVVTIIDVLEHVTDPMAILRAVRHLVADDGVIVVVTPDAGSLAARIFGWRWWHFRIAHVGYFNKESLGMALELSGFKLRKLSRPRWYFGAAYLFERLHRYLPWIGSKRAPAFLRMRIIPINLGDSLMGIYEPCAFQADRVV